MSVIVPHRPAENGHQSANAYAFERHWCRLSVLRACQLWSPVLHRTGELVEGRTSSSARSKDSDGHRLWGLCAAFPHVNVNEIIQQLSLRPTESGKARRREIKHMRWVTFFPPFF